MTVRGSGNQDASEYLAVVVVETTAEHEWWGAVEVPLKVAMGVVPRLEEVVVGNGIDKYKPPYPQMMYLTRTRCSCEVEYTE